MLRGFRNGVLLLLTGLVVAAPLFTALTPSIAAAVQDNPQDQLERWFYYRGMRACLEAPYFEQGTGDDNETISISDINEGHLWIQNRSGTIGDSGVYSDQKEGFGYIARDLDDLDGDDGTVQCTDGSIWVRGASIFGFDNVINLICAMNAALDEPDLDQGSRIDPQRDGGKCENAKEVYFDGDDSDIFQRALTRALESKIATKYGGDGDRPKITLSDNGGADYSWRALYYLLGKNSLETFCGGPLSSAAATDNYEGDDYDVSVYIVNTDGTLKKSGVGDAGFSHSYTVTNADRDQSSTVNDVYYKSGGNVNQADTATCADMAAQTREYAADYAKWAKDHQEEAEQNENTTGSNDTSGAGDATDTRCNVDGIGWIICPVMLFLAQVNDKAFEFLQGLLGIRPALIQDEGTLQAWSTFRDFANVLFVIGFMVIVYSQLTSAGISNYGIKKMLPKIVVAAILVNISYFICALMVDISNIVGSNIYSLLIGIANDAAGTGGGEASTWESIVSGLLIAGVGVLLIVALILAPTVLIALAIILLILIARQALVLILLILSPLAFAAYLLPNTEPWFKKWWKAFVTVLMVYPIIGVVFGASTLISNILMNIAQSDRGSGDDKELLMIVALAVLAIPLFAVPAILKGALSAMGSIGTRLQGYADRSQAGAMKSGTNRAKGVADNSAFMRGLKLRKDAKGQFKSKRFAEGVSGQDTSLMGRARRRASLGVTGRSYTDAGDYARQHMATAALSHALTAEDKEYEENVKGAALLQVGLTNAQTAEIGRTGMINGRKASQYELAAANDRIMKTGSFDERRQALEYLAANKEDPEHGTESLRNRAVQGAYSRGDQNIYGAGFGNEIVAKYSKDPATGEERGKINGAGDLMKATTENAKSGKVSAEHTVQGEASSKYLVSAVTDATHGDTTARANVKTAAAQAKTSPQTKSKYTTAMDGQFSSL